MFMADLARQINLPVVFDFMDVIQLWAGNQQHRYCKDYQGPGGEYRRAPCPDRRGYP